ncbi:MAG TPA: hypothetical protein VGC99_24890 [Candidatus Tectomicrobia bacterium]
MRYRSVPQLFLLVLAVIVSLAIGVSNVASNDFASLNVGLVSTTGDMVAMDCQDSGSGQPCEVNMPCAVICVGPVMALPPTDTSLERACSALDFATLLAKSMVGSSPPPELSPPRTTYIA